MGRKHATGKYDTRDELVAAVWTNSKLGLSDLQNGRAAGVSATTVANILRSTSRPTQPLLEESLILPVRAHRNQVLNRDGLEIAMTKDEAIAIVIANALNSNIGDVLEATLLVRLDENETGTD